MPKFGHQMSLRFVSKIVLQEALQYMHVQCANGTAYALDYDYLQASAFVEEI